MRRLLHHRRRHKLLVRDGLRHNLVRSAVPIWPDLLLRSLLGLVLLAMVNQLELIHPRLHWNTRRCRRHRLPATKPLPVGGGVRAEKVAQVDLAHEGDALLLGWAAAKGGTVQGEFGESRQGVLRGQVHPVADAAALGDLLEQGAVLADRFDQADVGR
uniref:(northern house mosquito) hypothetical protein n=1 Tax=Culex pipiens TaxID=7175 RepID=A0A8D8CLY6_CULPI